MKRLGRTPVIGIAPLRAVLAVVFLLLSALQPGLFATAAGFHADSAGTLAVEDAVQEAADSHVHEHVSEATTAESASADTGPQVHNGGGTPADKSCEVHCAPAHAVLVACPGIERVPARCFAPAATEAVLSEVYSTLIRPPRT